MITLSPRIKVQVAKAQNLLYNKRKIAAIPAIILLLIFIVTASYRSALDASTPVASPHISITRLTKEDFEATSPFRLVENQRQFYANEGFITSFLSKFGGSASNAAERSLLNGWKHADRLDQCRFLIRSMYNADMDWNNSNILEFKDDEKADNTAIVLMSERIRLYDYCFISGKLNLKQVFNEKLGVNVADVADFQHRMFPFMKKLNIDEMGTIPKITNLNNGKDETPIFKDVKTVNENFFAHWNEVSKGKGIVINMKETEKDLFMSLIATLQEVKNTLPIQIITTGQDFEKETFESMNRFLQTTDQQVSLIDCSSILDADFVKEHIASHLHKWFGTLFNTFEEVVILDADSVPFVAPETFFKNKEYKDAGSFFFRDKTLGNERTYQYCIEMIEAMEPSKAESGLINTKLKFTSNNPPEDNSSPAASVYNTFFGKYKHKNLDSGVVVLKKKEKLTSLLMGFMMNLDAKMKQCVSGEKELFWLGHLIAGQDYAIDQWFGTIAGTVGSMNDGKDGAESTLYICSTQVAHVNKDDDILWINGGLNTCKFKNIASKEFERSPSYFKQRYQVERNLQSVYDSAVKIDGLIKPDGRLNKWIQIDECQRRMYCAFIGGPEAAKPGAVDDSKTLYMLDKDGKSKLAGLTNVWRSMKASVNQPQKQQ
ncbi:hypothetical protein NCAS_0I00480 [Naumovozyma castellii]|uniref:Alpha-1,3-mannosyltransferase n=1 Tax=Naumovozyma castellii TaxID=27288 RepID=G0VJN6_NAUCA|nr:hypothetical protein NCAS_0I00480 [Naumovozyma castellii CBS 4309]CCC71716.1 hypothetical protein NCAS_0I00480 [Naumovozyma castellii CBS 4309]